MAAEILASLFGTALIIAGFFLAYACGVTDGMKKAEQQMDYWRDDEILFDHTHHDDLKNKDHMVQ